MQDFVLEFFFIQLLCPPLNGSLKTDSQNFNDAGMSISLSKELRAGIILVFSFLNSVLLN